MDEVRAREDRVLLGYEIKGQKNQNTNDTVTAQNTKLHVIIRLMSYAYNNTLSNDGTCTIISMVVSIVI